MDKFPFIKSTLRKLGMKRFFPFFIILLISSCQSDLLLILAQNNDDKPIASTAEYLPRSVPTLAPYFNQPLPATPAFQTAVTFPTPNQTSTQVPINKKTIGTKVRSVTIYSNALDSDWEIIQNTEVQVQQVGRPNTYEGRAALQVTPLQDFGQLIFVLKPDARNTYLRSKVLALSFWISGGPNQIETSDLGNTIWGSNDYPYWVAGDHSAWDSSESPFSDTRLYYLGINRAIPPHAWVEAINWLDERQYDPNYEYLTGFSIKNDEGFAVSYYIDEISILMIDEDVDSNANEINPSTRTLTPEVLDNQFPR